MGGSVLVSLLCLVALIITIVECRWQKAGLKTEIETLREEVRCYSRRVEELKESLGDANEDLETMRRSNVSLAGKLALSTKEKETLEAKPAKPAKPAKKAAVKKTTTTAKKTKKA